jgi:hypothetical protein
MTAGFGPAGGLTKIFFPGIAFQYGEYALAAKFMILFYRHSSLQHIEIAISNLSLRGIIL